MYQSYFLRQKTTELKISKTKQNQKNEKKKESTVVKPWALGKLFPMEL